MSKSQQRSLTLAALLICWMSSDSLSFAQSSTRGYPARQYSQGSASRHRDVALRGYCPVCLLNMNKWMRGSSAYSARYDGRSYYFPGAAQRDMFLANPIKYAPVLGGDCVTCYAKMGKRVPGNLNFATFYKKRLYLFAGEDQRKTFRENPSTLIDADLAHDGNCSVCLVEMKKEMPGKEEFTVLHKGLRYLFPGQKQQEMFLAHPAKYQVGGGEPRLLASEGRDNSTRQPGGTLAMGGYCSVCVKEMKKWVKGSPQHWTEFDGQTYYFPGSKQKQMFLADPLKYAPVLGGDCVVCQAKMNKRMPGTVQNAVFHQGRLYLFPGQKQKEMFKAEPDAYVDVDLALKGNCAVCLVEMKKEMPGKKEWTVVYRGLRYLFPGEKQRAMFMKNPERYRVPQSTTRSDTPAKQTSAKQTSIRREAQALAGRRVSIEGTSGCAGCDYGIQPMRDPDELGLAVKDSQGTIYVIEDAHRLYPAIYAKRFDGLKVRFSGHVLKQDAEAEKGKVVWIEPKHLSLVP